MLLLLLEIGILDHFFMIHVLLLIIILVSVFIGRYLRRNNFLVEHLLMKLLLKQLSLKLLM